MPKKQNMAGKRNHNDVAMPEYQKAKLLLLERITKTLVNTLSLKNVLKTITDGMVDVFGYAGSIIFMNDERHNSIILKALSYDAKVISSVEKLIGFSLDDHIFRIDRDELYQILYNKHKPVLTTDIAGMLTKLHGIKKHLAISIMQLLRIKSVLLMPLAVKNDFLGLLVVASRQYMDEEDLKYLKAFADHSAAAIERAKIIEDEQQRAKELFALHAILLEITSETDIQALLRTIIERASELLEADAGAIYFYNEEKNKLILEVATNFIEKYLKTELEPTKGLAGKVFKSGKPLIVDDYRTWEGRSAFYEDEKPFTAVMELPLNWHGQTIGVLSINADKEKRTFTQDDIWLAKLFADQAAIALENARLLGETHKNTVLMNKKIKDMQLIHHLSQVINSSLDLNHIMNTIVKQMTVVFNADHSGILIFDEAQKYGQVLAEYPHTGTINLRYSVTGYPAAELIINTKKPITIEDTWTDPLMETVHDKLRSLDIRSMLIVPLVVKDKVVGSIGLDAVGRKRRFTPEEVALALTIANQAAIAVGNARLYKKLIESETRFRDVTSNAGEWVWEINTKGRYIYSSSAITRILGYSPEEVLAKSYSDFFHREDYEGLKTASSEIIKERKPFIKFVTRNTHKDGKTVILETSGVPIFGSEGDFLGYRGVDRDITAELKAEETLRESEERYRMLVQSIDALIFSVDYNGKLYTAGGHGLRELGFSPEEATGRSIFDILSTGEAEDCMKHIHKVFQDGKSINYEYQLKSSGKRFVTQSIVYPVYNREKTIALVGIIRRDITKQRLLEEQLRQAQKMQTIGTLAGGIAHDFNNILAGIMGYASLMESQLEPDDPMKSDIHTIIQSSKRAADLTAQLLAFAQGGRYEVHPVNLKDTVKEVTKLLKPTIDKSITIKTFLTKKSVILEGDSAQLQQMLLNLCLNAADAMPEGGKLLIKTGNITLNEEYSESHLNLKPGNYVLLTVSDTGIGMSDETTAHIFEPFFTTKKSESGVKHSGLGMAMIYGIVHSHGGAIEVNSEQGKGTTFKVYLPATEHRLIRNNRAEKAPIGGTETILVTDDEKNIRSVLKRFLTKFGYTVLLAEDGYKAVELYRRNKNRIDLIILDMIMPELSGKKTYKLIRKINPEVKVLLSSGYSRNGQLQELMEEGLKGFLQKPYNLNEILVKVRNVLDEH